MKKIIIFLVVIMIAICMTGCSKNKEIKCTLEEDGEESLVKATLDGDKIIKIVSEYSVSFDSKSEYEEGYKDAQEYISNEEKNDKYSYGVKKNDKENKLTMIITYNINKYTQEELEDEFPFELTKKGFIESAEDSGYTCK